ncbi:hypothetical protein Pmani_008352 [Petrolisthes manimaculis]|uniref:Uncharacterized protein n=1 Tax=Petrolisthes manimaculis TaxID=1843537 RepID=A0AAE1Q6H9_9EUCA|nr:hypothetical protein Pmani_008352 [Petrolisthes manimaculis]
MSVSSNDPGPRPLVLAVRGEKDVGDGPSRQEKEWQISKKSYGYSVGGNQDGDVSHHRLITRPPGLPGYQPGRWCVVCGKTTSDKTSLTVHLVIDPTLPTPPVSVATTDSQDFSDTSDVTAADDDDDLEDLLQLDPRELVENIRQLRKELKRKKTILSFFEATSQTLAEKRDAVVTVLDLIDNICSKRSSAEEQDTRSIAATAKSHRIDEEWDRQVASSDVTANWWKSVKP